MGFNNPDVPWSEIERRLSDRAASGRGVRARHEVHPGDGGDAPAWSAQRAPYLPPPDLRPPPRTVPYAELHCHSSFSFLDGASAPEELVEEAVRLGLNALAVTDHGGFYGVVRLAEAARVVGLPTVFGVEVTIGATDTRSGPADPDGRHLVLLARDPQGYACLSALLSASQMAGEKGRPVLSFAAVAEAAAGRARGHWAVLTGCRKGTVPASLVAEGPAAAARELRSLVAAFGADHTFVELWDHGDPLDSARNDALAAIAVDAGVQVVAT
ncbi:MAG: PHP domain-containing protein, partial [Actinomycetes bacterium]